MRGKSATARQAAAAELRDALHVPDPALVAGRRILVYDDVFTRGTAINEVARALKAAGASRVSQVVLALHPWRAPSWESPSEEPPLNLFEA